MQPSGFSRSEFHHHDLPINLAITDNEVRFHGLEGDENKVTQYATELDKTLSVYDGILAKQKYLAGDEVTLADLYHLPYGKMAKDIGFGHLFEKYPNVKRWFESLENRESWKKIGHVGF